MISVSDRLLGMELNEAKSLLHNEGVNFVIKYTQTDRERDYSAGRDQQFYVVRTKKCCEGQELTVCKI